MKSQQIIDYGKPLCSTETERPVPSGTQVLVSVHSCGVCHSDLHLQDGFFELGNERKLDTTGKRALPFTLGHEIQGIVHSIGPDVNEIDIGQECVVFPWIGCGKCQHCDRGLENQCPRNLSLGTAVDGGFSEFVLVPHPKYILDANTIPNELAGIYMCSGLTAYSALKKVGKIPDGEKILIIGLGGVGIMGPQIARALHGDSIIVADISEEKRDAAVKLGAKEVYDPYTDNIDRAIKKSTNGGVYAAIDFVGSEQSASFSRKILQNGGKLILVGLLGGSMEVELPLLTLQGHSIVGSITGTLDEAKELLALAKEGAILPIPIESRPLEQANSALDDLRDGNVTGRIVLKP